MKQVKKVKKFCKRSDIHTRSMRRENGLYTTRLEFRRVRFAKNVSYFKSKQFLFHFTGFLLDFLALLLCFPLFSFSFFLFSDIFYLVPF